MASGSFASGQHAQPPQQTHQPPQQQQQQQPYAMDMGLGYPTAAAAAAAMGEAYHTQGNMFGRLDYQPQAEGPRPPPPQRRRRQQGSNGGNASVQAAAQTPMGTMEKQQQQHMGQFGILAPTPMPVAHPHGSMPPTMGQQTLHFAPALQAGAGAGTDDAAGSSPAAHGKIGGKIVVDPPDLQAWREKLFSVDEMIVLTQDQFETYFPHVDNVYSHRSTQKYKRKPFVSHYWDCRMKGRPPGTPKTEDPTKKRRRRSARERDLCDVKIKITEYFPSAEPFQLDGSDTGAAAAAAAVAAGYHGQRFWTIQRVNGNGGNGKGDGVAGPHKHTLARSDEIKKNSVQRHVAAQDKEAKRAQPVTRRPTGAAATTAKKHGRDSANDLRLYAACHCPFSQRVWIALEAKGVAYQYCETDPHRKPPQPALLEANPKGQVPAIRQGEWACSESPVILEFLEDLDSRVPLLPSDARLKANCRFWINHINTDLLAAFYALLRNTDLPRQADLVARLQAQLDKLAQAADEHGPYFLGSMLSLVDVHIAPFAVRLRTILHPRRGWPAVAPEAGSRWARWLDALEQDAHVKATTSGDELYADTADLLIKNAVPVPL
ncbi:hypothetical protein LMH87_012102 [Akanthomyces muscarius]|uniref:Glutathione transferase n=1 Tax=Akanthomyces muscarius TaxID=2231603 RepID=A0A9W8ULU4_AKAMU|nr:hypothetical protein LMH87_012102 [Akanthomyces muscarius]KAJ4151400.1 hypothetical protein LMH87_012102 [Akanthomyces muscarius]